MSHTKQKRARPAIAPIKTNALVFKDQSGSILTPSKGCLCAFSPSSPRPGVGAASPIAPAADRLTPFILDSAKAGLSPSVGFHKLSIREHSEEPSGATSPTAVCRRCGEPIRLHFSVSRNWLYFHRYRAMLWKQGARTYGDSGHDAVFVKPTRLPKLLASPADKGQRNHESRTARKLHVCAAIHSKGRAPIIVKRDFDLEQLQATIPDPIPSPRTHHPDRIPPPGPLSARGTRSPVTPAPYSGPVTRSISAAKRAQGSDAATPTSSEDARTMDHPSIPIRK
ncbi:hypothetical protein HIM_03092 [Hirsutella minnesotensis 3608]|nr:hypothetical protein HIM_03092 [Hirsutella minnesotensis 3608]